MSTYYEYRDIKVMIAHKLMNIEGWKVYGYSADQSDFMTDYYCPAHWGGVAEKNGYVLCVNVYGAAKQEEIRKYNHSAFVYDHTITEKIKKLEAMTVERGASEQEQQSAKTMIERLQKKAEESTENNNKYIVTGYIPAHMENPPKANWHIEKDGIIIAKGNGILKYSKLDSYYNYSSYMNAMNDFKTMTKDEYIKNNIDELMRHNYYSDEEKAKQSAESHYNEMIETKKLMDQFESFINKLDTTCGGLIGSCDGVIYEKVKVTEYKTENKAIETTTGSIKEGQCFIVKTSFNYGHNKGYVYRIHVTEYEGRKSYHAIKLNRKLTKECNGTANQSNHWYMTDNFIRWFEKGSLVWCDIAEVKTPYEVEKVVKKVIKAEAEGTTMDVTKESTATTEQPQTTELNGLHYEIKEDTDTRDNSKIFVVKVAEKLDRDEYIKTNNYMKSIGGYYSKFKHGFIFKNDPIQLLNSDIQQDAESKTNSKAQETAENITDYSTQAIEELGLKYPEYINNEDYISLLASKISYIKLNNNIIDCIEYDGLKQALRTILSNQKKQADQEQKQANKQKLIDKINKQIESAQKKIDNLSGDYKTNTWKRINEQASRDSKIEGYQQDINILQYLIDTLDSRTLTLLEENLIISSFRDEIDVYYRRNEVYNKPNKGTALTPIKFPEINYNTSLDSWWNAEVPKKQKRLQRANINNTSDLLKAVEEYKLIYDLINKPVNYKEKKIKQLEREYKMQQKGDIHFTPSEIAKQLIEYAGIDSHSIVLEPSAGIGNIADQIKQYTNNIDVCEQMYHFSQLLELKGYNVVENDFMEYKTDKKYDAIIMNPPFSDEQNHIKHAYKFLKDGGKLVSITSPHWTFANDKKSLDFRKWIEDKTYCTKDLKSGAFEMTGVATKVIAIEK